jgi:hypothetical protein
LSLRVVEVSGHSDDGLLDGVTEVGLSGFLHLGEDEGTDLGGRVLLSTSFNPCVSVAGLDDLVGKMLHILLGDSVVESTADETLGGEQSILWVLYGLK